MRLKGKILSRLFGHVDDTRLCTQRLTTKLGIGYTIRFDLFIGRHVVVLPMGTCWRRFAPNRWRGFAPHIMDPLAESSIFRVVRGYNRHTDRFLNLSKNEIHVNPTRPQPRKPTAPQNALPNPLYSGNYDWKKVYLH
jgi:hypothetical protein